MESYPLTTVPPDTSEDVIKYVRVECNGSGKVASIQVSKATGSTTKLVGIEEFSTTSNDGTTDGDVWATIFVQRRSNQSGGVVGLESQVGGIVSAHAIGQIIAEGDINASIVAMQSSVGAGNIEIVRSNRGIYGDVVANYGAILTEIWVNNDIGSAGNPVTIFGKNGVNIVKGNNIYADISYDTSIGSPVMERLYAVGNFTGSLVAGKFEQNGSNKAITIGGDLIGDIRVNDYVKGSIEIAEIVSGGRLRIGGNFNESGRTFIAGPIAGQVMINALNQGGTWTVPSIVNGTSLTGIPAYTQTAAQLGGGAIGRVPFRLHATDCDPPNGAAVASLNRIKLRFYGPITVAAGQFPVVVQYCPNIAGCTPQQWVDLSDHFTATVSTSARQITLTWSPPAGSQWGGAMPDGIWFAEPTGPGVIKCSDLFISSPPDVASFEYSCILDSSM